MISQAKRYFLLLFFIFSSPSFSQSEIVPIENPVYLLLKLQSVKGNITGFEDLILPLYREQIDAFLDQLESRLSFLTADEIEQIKFFRNYFPASYLSHKGVTSGDKIPFLSVLWEREQNYFYKYSDSTLSFSFNPRAALKAVRSDNSGRDSVSGVMQYGGKFLLNYEDWLVAELDAWNGNIYNSRAPAKEIKEVEQSLTFNKTGLNNFDGTTGYIRMKQKLLNLHFGRNQILWGRGSNQKLMFGYGTPVFDYLLADFKYKALGYTFLHGWLNEKVTEVFPDSVNKLQLKLPKYVAVSRIGYTPGDNFRIGISQTVIYGSRPFEAAYLNPFLFWESAQRSLNDIDNSFLSLDLLYRPFNGMEFTSTLMLDDIHFGNYFDNGLESKSNRSALQAGLSFANPFFLNSFILELGVLIIRPYTFSHPGFGQTSSYTNNGYNLGTTVQPNSVSYSVDLRGFIIPVLTLETGFCLTKHGKNVTDSYGQVIQNVGGDVNLSYNYFTPETTPLLAGEVEIIRSGFVKLNYFLSYNLTLSSFVKYSNTTSSAVKSETSFLISLSYGFL